MYESMLMLFILSSIAEANHYSSERIGSERIQGLIDLRHIISDIIFLKSSSFTITGENGLEGNKFYLSDPLQSFLELQKCK